MLPVLSVDSPISYLWHQRCLRVIRMGRSIRIRSLKFAQLRDLPTFCSTAGLSLEPLSPQHHAITHPLRQTTERPTSLIARLTRVQCAGPHQRQQSSLRVIDQILSTEMVATRSVSPLHEISTHRDAKARTQPLAYVQRLHLPRESSPWMAQRYNDMCPITRRAFHSEHFLLHVRPFDLWTLIRSGHARSDRKLPVRKRH